MDTQRALSVRGQVDRILRERIFGGEYELGTRLPPESVLATELGVSRATIRTSFGKLEAEGVITRRHGDGTYLNKHALEVDARPAKIMAFKTMIEESGRRASVITLSVGTRRPTEEEAEKLQISETEEVISLVCLFLADAQPAIYSSNLFPRKVIATETEDFDVNQPMHDFLRQYAGQELAYSVSDFCAVLAPPQTVEHLGVNAGEPLLFSVDLFYGLKDVPLALGSNYFHPQAYRLRLAQSWIGRNEPPSIARDAPLT